MNRNRGTISSVSPLRNVTNTTRTQQEDALRRREKSEQAELENKQLKATESKVKKHNFPKSSEVRVPAVIPDSASTRSTRSNSLPSRYAQHLHVVPPLQQSPSGLEVKSAEVHAVKVVVRKRPAKEGEADCVRCEAPMVICTEKKQKVDLTKYEHMHKFVFDSSFGELASTRDLFEESVRPLVDNFVAGGSSTCFCFGQTASGKTFTIFGSGGGQVLDVFGAGASPDKGGVYMLAAQDVFARLRSMPDLTLAVSMFEIYGQKVRDLLNGNKELMALEDGKGVLQLVGLTREECDTMADFIRVSNVGRSARSTTATGANATSSRSHAALFLQLVKRGPVDPKKPKVCLGKFSLIDLAGSERGSDNVNTGKTTQMEGRQINTSLLVLKEVIRAKELGRPHVPFRQSRLTQVLEESLSGKRCKTLVIGCISAEEKDIQQTVNTMRYAEGLRPGLKKDLVRLEEESAARVKAKSDADALQEREGEERISRQQSLASGLSQGLSQSLSQGLSQGLCQSHEAPSLDDWSAGARATNLDPLGNLRNEDDEFGGYKAYDDSCILVLDFLHDDDDTSQKTAEHLAHPECKLTVDEAGQRTRRSAKSALLQAVTVPHVAAVSIHATESSVIKGAAKLIKATSAVTTLRRGSKDETAWGELLAERDAELAERDLELAAQQKRITELNRALNESDELRAQQTVALKRLRERLEVTEREYGGAVTTLETQLDNKVALVGELEVKLERREAQMEKLVSEIEDREQRIDELKAMLKKILAPACKSLQPGAAEGDRPATPARKSLQPAAADGDRPATPARKSLQPAAVVHGNRHTRSSAKGCKL